MNNTERQQFAQHIAALNCFAAVDLNMPYEDAVRTLECISATLKSLKAINDEHLELIRQRIDVSSSSSEQDSTEDGREENGEQYFIEVIDSAPPPLQRSTCLDYYEGMQPTTESSSHLSAYIPQEFRYANRVFDLTEESSDSNSDSDSEAPIHPNITIRRSHATAAGAGEAK
ncbi:hypothetical protein EB093_07480 [bacterium]|nr:hypothetical protein [bacterium]